MLRRLFWQFILYPPKKTKELQDKVKQEAFMEGYSQ